MAIDFSNLKKVDKANSQPSTYDMRYSVKQEKFKIGNDLWDKLNLDTNGLTAFVDTENNKMYIGVGNEASSVLLKRRKNSSSKTHEFTSTQLRKELDQVGIKSIDVNFLDTGEQVPQKDGTNMHLYEIVAADGSPNYDEEQEQVEETEHTPNASIV